MSVTSPLDTLFLPLTRGDVPWGAKTLLIGADWHDALAEAPNPPDVWTSSKPAADRLAKKGLHTMVTLPKDTYDLVLVAVPKQVEEARFWLAMGLSCLSENGSLVAAAGNDANGSRLEKWLTEAGATNVQSDSKNKARVVWATHPNPTSIVQEWKAQGGVRALNMAPGVDFLTQPGLFSWDRLDPASRLLVDNFSPAITGYGADFGCGYGYLSYCALRNHPKISDMILIDADARALDCARQNLRDVQGDRPLEFLWQDATRLPSLSRPLDFILMNPPFHTGKGTDVDLGRGFIAAAAACLKKGGSLSLVANAYLPYEAVLEPLFKNVKLITQKDGFKVIRAVK